MQKCTKLENNKATKYREQKKQNLKKLVFNKTKPDFNKKIPKMAGRDTATDKPWWLLDKNEIAHAK